MENNENIVCPYCGHENTEEKSLLEFEAETKCEDCGKQFEYVMTVTYTSYKKIWHF